MAKTLDARALNRALLARQLLLTRAELDVPTAVERLVGLQAQNQHSPYVALWSRLRGFAPERLGAGLEAREFVRLAMLRSTVHLVTARDALALRPVLQEVSERGLYVGSPFGRKLEGMDVEALVVTGRALVEAQPRTAAELGVLLAERWPDRDAAAMSQAIRALLPLVQVPPRGVWGKGGLARSTTAQAWLGRPLATDVSADELVLRYLAAFGPATIADAQTWSGLRRLRAVFERLRPRLIALRDDQGRELFDLPDAPRPGADAPAPVRFLPDYDNVALGHADRSRIVDESARAGFRGVGDRSPGSVLIDGFVAGLWLIERPRGGAYRIEVRLFGTPSRADRAAVAAEGEGLLALLAADQPRRELVLH